MNPFPSRTLSAAVLVALTLRPAFATAADNDLAILRKTSQAFASLAEKALPAVVSITVEKTIEQPGAPGFFYNDPYGFFGEDFLRRYYQYHGQPYRPPTLRGQGSGFLISKDGYILTNNHVVGDADKIRVRTSDGKEYDATRIGSDPKSEVALIRIEGDDFPFVPIGDSAALRIGEWVVAIGNPFGIGETLTVGVVSAKGRRMDIADYEDFIQTDAAINPGNSGGPLLNIDGQAVGINTAIYSPSGGNVGIGLAIPINMARAIKDQLVESGHVVRGYLGVRIKDMTPDYAAYFGPESATGILVDAVEFNSPAQQAGLRDGDVIVQLGDDDVHDVATFRNQVSGLKPGTPVTLAVIRDGERQSIPARIGSLPGEAWPGPATPEPESGTMTLTTSGKLGLSVSNLTPPLAQAYGVTARTGVVVTQVDPNGVSATVGIQPGDLINSVNRTVVSSVDEFRRALKGSERTKSVLLRVQRGPDAQYVVIRID
ncbi:MAG: Do family serine endopeptidase [Lentisphaerae bacterium]|nr:Do family serine endopeptidase [Lentisphaerota bacterium]